MTATRPAPASTRSDRIESSREHHVFRLDVAMHDVYGMRRGDIWLLDLIEPSNRWIDRIRALFR